MILSRSSVPVQLAVLPFAPTTNDPSSKAFGDGLTETLTAKLAQLSGNYPLQVVATSEIRAEGVTSVEQARKNFGVGLVLEGNLHSSGNQVRVNYSLVDAETNRQLSADTVDADVSDAFAVEDQVVDGVLHMLGLSIQSNERVVLAAHGTGDPTAYDQYPARPRISAGLSQTRKHRECHFRLQPRSYPRSKISARPMPASEKPTGSGMERAWEAASGWRRHGRPVIRLWPTRPALPTVMSAWAACTGTGASMRKPLPSSRRRQPLTPSTMTPFVGWRRSIANSIARPRQKLRTGKPSSLRPQYWAGYSWLGAFYREEGRYDDAARMFQEVVTLAPDNFRGYSNLGAMYVVQGKYPQAIALLEKSIAIRPTVEVYDNLGTAYFYMRKFDGAAANYEEGLKFDKTSWLSWGNLGDAYRKSRVNGTRPSRRIGKPFD